MKSYLVIFYYLESNNENHFRLSSSIFIIIVSPYQIMKKLDMMQVSQKSECKSISDRRDQRFAHMR